VPEGSRDEWSAPTQRLSPFVTLCGVGFLGRLSYEMIRSPVTTLYARHLGAPVELIGLIVSAVTITGIFVKLPSGALSDLFGFRRLMMAGAWVKATGPFVYLAAFTWPVLLAVSLLPRPGDGPVRPAGLSARREGLPRRARTPPRTVQLGCGSQGRAQREPCPSPSPAVNGAALREERRLCAEQSPAASAARRPGQAAASTSTR
jgi:MFS family permease